MQNASQTIHATTVAHSGRALLIFGPSGSGKSSLALTLMAYGAMLVSDDRTILTPTEGRLIASAPEALLGKIEARGIGILTAEPAPSSPVALAVDMAETEDQRLPLSRELTLMGHQVPLVHKSDHPSFAAGLMLYLKGSRVD